jgi:hypothetical protein
MIALFEASFQYHSEHRSAFGGDTSCSPAMYAIGFIGKCSPAMHPSFITHHASSRQANKKERLPYGKRPWFGGAEEDRTPDLNTASVALSQLSYSPMRPFRPTCVVVVEVRRLELLTSTVRLSRSPS